MSRIITPVLTTVIRGSVFGGLIMAIVGLSSSAEARPLTSSVKAVDHQFSSEAELLRLVEETRIHDESVSADRSTAEKNSPKKQMDKPMKQAPVTKKRSGRDHEIVEYDAKNNKSSQSKLSGFEQLNLTDGDEKVDRPHDRRQSKNPERKP